MNNFSGSFFFIFYLFSVFCFLYFVVVERQMASCRPFWKFSLKFSAFFRFCIALLRSFSSSCFSYIYIIYLRLKYSFISLFFSPFGFSLLNVFCFGGEEWLYFSLIFWLSFLQIYFVQRFLVWFALICCSLNGLRESF